MRSTVALILTALCSAAAAAQNTGRLFFDTAGNGGNQSAPHPGGLAMVNPALNGNGGRLYIYWQFGRPSGQGQNVLGLNYNITTDSGTIARALNYQPTIDVISQPRWQNVPGNPAPNPAINPGGNSARFTAVNINQFGLKNDAAAVALDQGYDDAASNSTILGYVDIVGGDGPVWITVDTLGIAIEGGSPADQIYMGFGDEPVPAGGSPGLRSRIPEANIPEPATLMLLVLGSAVLGRSRLAGRARHAR